MVRSSSQLAGNSAFPGLPVPCRCPPPQLSPSRMCLARSGGSLIESGTGRPSRCGPAAVRRASA